MELSSSQIQAMGKRILDSRTRVLLKHPFFGLLLMNIGFSLDSDVGTAATNGEKIIFSPEFLNGLSNDELDFILMHEVLHAALQHCYRGHDYLDQELFNVACDIVVNSTICKEEGMNFNSITVGNNGSSMHSLPNGDEGYLHSCEDAYGALILHLEQKKKLIGEDIGCGDTNEGKASESSSSANKGKGSKSSSKGKTSNDQGDNPIDGDGKSKYPSTIDSHERWPGELSEDKQQAIDRWNQRLKEAAEAVQSMGCGNIPLCIQRALNELTKSQVDWKEALVAFVQEDIVDFSFNPPDYRFQDTPFLLPSFSEKDDSVKNILFMIDTSGSMSNSLISTCFSEIKGAIDQFDGRLAGYLGYFDAVVQGVEPFEDEMDILENKPKGGGGTNFAPIFKWIHDSDLQIDSIIILTDGIAPIPSESIAYGIPTMWVLVDNNQDFPWGRTIHINSKNI